MRIGAGDQIKCNLVGATSSHVRVERTLPEAEA